jgi:uncharacterized protein
MLTVVYVEVRIMMGTGFSQEEKKILLELARLSIERSTAGNPLPEINLESYPERLREDGASFVTLTQMGQLRGCIGALEAYQPLVQDVCEHAQAAALEDYRFPPVRKEEVPLLHIEISVLTKPQVLEYQDASDLVSKLRPGVDGVILRDGMRRSTFLPQVWEKIPIPENFLSQLCMKMGTSAGLWKQKKLNVMTYQVVEFHE